VVDCWYRPRDAGSRSGQQVIVPGKCASKMGKKTLIVGVGDGRSGQPAGHSAG